MQLTLTGHFVSLISGLLWKNLKEPIKKDINLTFFINFSTKVVQKLLRLGVKTKCNVESTFTIIFLKIQVSCSI